MSRIQQANKAYLLIAISLNFAPLEKILSGTQINVARLDELEYLEMADAITIVHNLFLYSKNKIWPALLGRQLGMSSHGPVGYASISAPTLGKALSTFVQWYTIRTNCYQSEIIEADKSIEIIIHDTSGDLQYQAFFFEALMRAFELFIGLLIGQSLISKLSIHFKSIAKNRQYLMLQEYDSQLHFGSQENKMCIPKEYWFQASPLYDKDSYDFNLAKCQSLYQQMQDKDRIDIKVENELKTHFEKAALRTEPESQPPRLDDLSRKLNTSPRTLIRKLKHQNSSYKTLLEAQRRECAEKLLRDVRFSIYEIAEILGYKESANFTRAFKKWFGVSPSVFRRNPTIN